MTTKNMTMNILKKLAGTFALAAAAFAAPFSASAEGGDITAIFPVDAKGANLSTPVSLPTVPLQSGDVIRFAVRLAKRTGSTDTDWALVHTGLGSEVVDLQSSPFALGLYVAGDDVPRYATYDGTQTAEGYTDVYFRYEVRPGDFAMPAILAVGQDNPQPANKSLYSDLAYHVSPSALSCWAIQSQTTTTAVPTVYTANLMYKVSTSVTNQDFDLRTAGFYVKTIDFDDAQESDAWRSVPAGTTAQGSIHVESMPTNSMTFYVWSMDESVVKVEGSMTKLIHVETPTATEARSVGVIKVIAGQQDYNFRFTGDAAAAGSSTTLVLSAYDDFNYQDVSNEKYTDYLTATVKVTTAPEPYMSLTDATGKSTVKVAATSNTTDYTEMRLTFSKAFTKDVVVTLEQQIDGTAVAAADDYVDNRYIAILTDPEANPVSTPSVKSITMTAGETEARFYVFGLGSTTDLSGVGLTLVPTVTDAEAAAFFAAGSHKSALLKVTDQLPTVVAEAPTSAYCGDTISIDVTVSDNWRDLQTTGAAAWNTDGYKVQIDLGGSTVLTANGVAFTEDGTLSFDVKVPVEGKPLTGVVKVWDPTHTKAATADVSIANVEAARAASAKFYPTADTSGEPFNDAHFFAEGDTPYFCVTLTSDAPQDMYAFLIPQNEEARNLVECAAYTNGLFISAGARTSKVATIKFLDGYSAASPMRAKFTVDLRSRQDYNDPNGTSYDTNFVMRNEELACTNIPPSIVANSMTMNNTPVANGAELAAAIPVGVPVRFIASLYEPSSNDLAAVGSKAIVTRWQFTDGNAASKTVTTEYATNEVAYSEAGVISGTVSCTHDFNFEGQTQTVTVWARDKDDVAQFGDAEWGDPKYTFTVRVVSAPRVIFCKDSSGTEVTTLSFDETCERGDNNLYIRLSDRPSGGSPAISETNPLLVNLKWERVSARGCFELVTNMVAFVNSSKDTRPTAVKFDLDSLNGATDKGTRYLVTANVVTDDSFNEFGQAWSDYYVESTVDVYVNNIAPEIVETTRDDGDWVESAAGTNTCAAGEIFTINWRVTDVMPDLTNGKFTVSWSITPTASSPTMQRQTIPVTLAGYNPAEEGRVTSIENKYIFAAPTSAGTRLVTMTVNDGDGGIVTKEWLLDVTATKDIVLNVYGPAETAQSKYKAATGVGQGFVAAMGNPATSIAGFVRTFAYAETAGTAEIYAFGYPSRDTWDNRWAVKHPGAVGRYLDDGTIPGMISSSFSSIGNALEAYGGLWTTGDDYYDFSVMGWLDDETAGDYDSFFYTWVVTKEPSKEGSSSDTSSSSASGSETITPSPTLESLVATRKIFDLDSGSKESTTYGAVEAEAVFSRELYPLDNLGDINADGIPDKIVELYGIGADAAGKIPDDDLTSLRDFNDDEDYLPNSSTAASYSSLIPGVSGSWGDKAAFTAKLEVRGYGDGLNDGAQLAGLKKHKLHPDYNSDDVDKRKAARDYSELEMIAWSLVDYDKDWSPERPSDPTKADTDGDGFPDGYEYYFWYRAHVGDPDYFAQSGICRKITGRRYDPRNPGDGTVISSEEIEAIMDPRVAYSGDAKTLDTDNDGLPDLLELELGTNPFDFDTDGDGLPDGWEVMIANLDPLVTQSYADGLSDTMRNTDGDAMAISSYKLEKTQSPVPVNYEHAKRLTFAVVDANGDTAGIQWYALPISTNSVELEANEAFAGEGFKLVSSVDGLSATFFSNVEPELTAAGLLKRDVSVWTLTTYKPAGAEAAEDVVAYPYVLRAGAAVRNEGAVTAKQYQVKTAIGAKGANACWIYGKGSARAELGEVAETAADYGCLALARQKAVPAGAVIAAFPSEDRDVAFLHYLCYQEFGFDPRTAWSTKSPLASRWGKITNGEAEEDVIEKGRGAYTGTPSRTRDYANYDEVLVRSFFQNNTPDDMGYNAIDVDSNASAAAKIWYAFTTNPNGPTDDLTATSTNFYGRTSTNGADTDGDGVPDGWELYTMAGPKTRGGAYVFAPPYAGFSTSALVGDDTGIGLDLGDDSAATEKLKMPQSYFSPFVASAKSSETSNQIYLGGQGMSDGLNQFQEFEGTDSIAAYTNVSTTIAHEGSWKWLNKFFPTDPWNPDTDGDGVTDASEKSAFSYGELGDDGLVDNGTSRCIAGGGLNPCSVDTDFDGLPDGWELQFTGTAASVVKQSEGMLDGMDGTVSDACTTLGGPNRDYDHDGLENWQEYLTGTMRCWRYDDPISPLTYWPSSMYCKLDEKTQTYEFDFDTAVENFKAAGYLVKDGDEANGEFLYKTFVDATSPMYNPHLVMDRAAGSQYFSHLTNVWDAAYLDASQGGKTGAYYWFYDRINDTKLSDSWFAAWEDLLKEAGLGEDITLTVAPSRYASCSPIDPDSDHDGMDDYYEVFHGMNPLLGESGVCGNWWHVNNRGSVTDSDPCDLVFDSLSGASASSGNCVPQAWGEGDGATSFKNFWQRKVALDSYEGLKPRGTGYDFVVFPWLNGLATADADGDGIRNQEEAIMALVSPASVWHHTDPTALWMTDSSYTNSLVSMNYRLANRSSEIKFPADKFTEKNGKYCFVYDGKEYVFNDLDGYGEIAEGLGKVPGILAFSADAWSVIGSDDDANGWIASFEENEGFDTDHDGLGDRDEISGKFRGKTDPIDVDSPTRRQAMYFQGADKPSILQTMPFVPERHPYEMKNGQYPDDMSFLQYTVECWVKAESLDDSTIIERAVYVGRSNPDDQEFVRCNFRLAISGGKWLTCFDPNDTTQESVELYSSTAATTEWTHLAATYDAAELRLYVNGKLSAYRASSLQPAYGSSSVTVDGAAGVHASPGMGYWRDREYDLNAIIVGASAKTKAQGATDGTALDVTRGGGFDLYTNFFKGYVDEVRVWDGARSATQILGSYATRFTADDAAANRNEFYAEWIKLDANGSYRGRYSKDDNGAAYSLPAELRFHWAFDSLFGASDESAVAKVPSGFNLGNSSDEDGARARRTRPDDYAIDWWQNVLAGYAGTVYDDPSWICWVPNTVAHLPRYDGTTLDSVYWSEDFAGEKNGTYKFVCTAEPVSFWTQYRREGVSEGDPQYDTTSSRYHFVVEQDATNETQFTGFYEFTGRHLNQSGDDMLALGGAYAKHIDAMWDSQGPSSNWEIAGTDGDGDGLPDWWEEYAEDMYRDDDVTGSGDIGWDTLVVWPDQDGTVMKAGEAYLRDLARGYHGDANGTIVTDGSDGDYSQRADLNGNGIPDWWEKIYGIEGESALDDHDNDGLPNYVEYLLSEVFKFKGVVFDPSRADSVQEGIPDYFYRVGSLYVGEIFTDHDLVDDSWEDLYDTSFASRLAYDAFADKDEDGWSNRSECRYDQQCRPIVASYGAHATESEGIVRDHPIPTMNVKLRYNGARRKAVEHADLGVFVRSEELANKVSTWADPDAFYWVQGGTTDNTLDMDTADAGTGNGESITRTFGKWSDRHVVGTMEPGNLVQTSIKLKYSKDPYAMTYSWYADSDYTFDGTNDTDRAAYYVHVEHCGYAHHREGTVEELRKDRAKYGAAHVFVEQKSSSYTELTNFESVYDENTRTLTWTVTANKKILARINVATGAYDIDLGALRECSITSANGISTSLEDLCYRLDWMGNAAMSFPRRLYLGSATSGFVREGKNTVMVYADVNSNQTYDVGEPLGVARGVNVSWRMSDLAEIELLETNPLFARYNLVSGTTDREAVWVAGSTDVLDTGSEKITTDSDQRVRVVRCAVDNAVVKDGTLPTDYMAVVFDRTLRTVGSGKIWLTEDDILSSVANEFDLDWNAKAYDSTRMNLDEVATKIQGLKSASGLTFQTTNVYYAVVVGNGDIAPHTPTNFLSKMIVRCFDVTRQLPTLFAPTGTVRGTGSANDSVVYDAAPTFQWTMNGNNTYTAFKLQVLKDSTVIYDSGYQRMPPVDDKGRYSWTAPVFAGDKTTTGAVVDNGRSYSWRLSVYNAKFRSDSFVSSEPYYLNVQTNHPLYAVQPVAVRYFGPKESYAGKPIHVQAFESPDFIGMPVASAYVPAPDDPESGVSVTESVAKANATLIGLPKGTYYLRAYIDSNNNGVCDSWETMGYLCTRDGTVSNSLDPVALEYATQCGKGDVVQIFMEDADTDQDGLPDAWEYATYGSLTKKGIELLSETPTGQILVNKSLSGALELKEDASIPTLSLAGQALSTIRSAGTVALALGLSEPTTGTFADNISSAISPELTEDGVSISSLTIDADGNISLTVDVKAEDASVSSVFTSVVTVPKTIDVTCTVYHTASLAEEWKAFPSQTLTISVGTQTETLSLPTKADASSGFYKVEITK